MMENETQQVTKELHEINHTLDVNLSAVAWALIFLAIVTMCSS
jgi:hypothetical protein